jgi:uncharacterized protein (DUF4415 family)
MNGSKTNLIERKKILNAMKTPPSNGYFVWDGIDEDERPATEEELCEGIALARSRERPSGSNKTQIALRVDNSVLAAFRATGNGWQTRMNEALKEWLKEHAV